MGSNQDYKNRALASLEGNWSTAIIATLICFVISIGVNWTITTPMGDDFVMNYSTSSIWGLLCLPLEWGLSVFFLNLIRREDINYGRLFDGYKDFIRIFLAGFLVNLAVLIGTFLLIVPGIILAMMFSQTCFILKDDPQISAIDAMAKSMQMMKGHKAELFWLYLSFIGWAILACLTLGIGFLILVPYMYTTIAHYYEDLKAEKGI